jgi:hypothetical protein
MDLRVLRLAFLLMAALTLARCASADDTAGDPANDVVPVPSHDDSHGWGTNVKGL